MRKTKKNPKAASLQNGSEIDNKASEKAVYEWILQQRFSELTDSTTNVVEKALYLDPTFKEANSK